MRTHTDITTAGAVMVNREQSQEVCLYMLNLVEAFGECKQVQVSWDASTYDTETLVSCVYDPASGPVSIRVAAVASTQGVVRATPARCCRISSDPKYGARPLG